MGTSKTDHSTDPSCREDNPRTIIARLELELRQERENARRLGEAVMQREQELVTVREEVALVREEVTKWEIIHANDMEIIEKQSVALKQKDELAELQRAVIDRLDREHGSSKSEIERLRKRLRAQMAVVENPRLTPIERLTALSLANEIDGMSAAGPAPDGGFEIPDEGICRRIGATRPPVAKARARLVDGGAFVCVQRPSRTAPASGRRGPGQKTNRYSFRDGYVNALYTVAAMQSLPKSDGVVVLAAPAGEQETTIVDRHGNVTKQSRPRHCCAHEPKHLFYREVEMCGKCGRTTRYRDIDPPDWSAPGMSTPFTHVPGVPGPAMVDPSGTQYRMPGVPEPAMTG